MIPNLVCDFCVILILPVHDSPMNGYDLEIGTMFR